MSSTQIQCTCGATVDTAVALPGEPIECPGCGRTVVAAAPPPGVAFLAAGAVAGSYGPEGSSSGWAPSGGGGVGIEEEEEGEEVVAGLIPAAPPPPPEHVAKGAPVSQPVGVGVEWWHYFRGFPAPLATAVVAVALGAAGVTFVHPAYVLLGLLGVVSLGAEVAGAGRRFRSGHACAAVVVSESRSLVAVLDDLRAPGVTTPMPAVRMLWQPLRRLAGGVPAEGTRLTAVARYELPVRKGRYADFRPQVLRCVTRNEVHHGRVAGLLSEQDWLELERHVSGLARRRAGLYTMWDQNRYGRRRTWYVRVVNSLVTLLVVAAVLLPLLTFKMPQPKRDIAPGFPPGRIHTDWNR